MKQPVSIDSFDPRAGRVGVYLQEGGPLTDALWNESSDIHMQMLRWLALDAGLAGTCGPELHVTPGEHCGQPTLILEGGPGRFYCNGLPILWPDDVRIEEQSHCCKVLHNASLKEGEHWTLGLKPGSRYWVVLDVWVDEIDECSHPYLDDPALFCASRRGSFRKAVRRCVRVVSEEPGPLPNTNVELTIQGHYLGSSNGLFAVELLGVRLHGRKHWLELLWDDAGASTASRVTEEAEPYSDRVRVESVEGFTPGHFVRFEGIGDQCCGHGEIYEMTDVENDTLVIRRSRCGREVTDLRGCEPKRWAPVPESLAYELTISVGCHPDERLLAVEDLVMGVADAPDRVWIVDAILCGPQAGAACCDPNHVKYRLVPDGLAHPLAPWDTTRGAKLARPAHPFSWCVTTVDRPDWHVGMRIKLTAHSIDDTTELPCGTPDPPDPCEPGRSRVRAEEVRTITKIVRCCQPRQCCEGEDEDRDAEPLMTLRLDAPLSYEHIACFDSAIPECPVRAVRYRGHECKVAVGELEACGERENGPCCLKNPLELSNGLELFFTTPMTDDPSAPAPEPTVVPGDGWRFAVRANGWVQSKVFAPVDPRLRCRTTLAEFVWDGKAFTKLDDLRERPCCCPEKPEDSEEPEPKGLQKPEEPELEEPEEPQGSEEPEPEKSQEPEVPEVPEASEELAGTQEPEMPEPERLEEPLEPRESRGHATPSSASQLAPQRLLSVPLTAVRCLATVSRKSRNSMLRKWPTLELCYLDGEQLQGRHQQIVHEAVSQVVRGTLRIAQIAQGIDDERSQRELEKLWTDAIKVELLPRPVHLVDALWMLEHGPDKDKEDA